MNRFHVECRAEVAGKTLSGHAAVYGPMAKLPSHYERMANTAFDEVLKRGDDIAALFNHDPNMPLGRTGSGTLKVSSDNSGLYFELALPDTTHGRDVQELAERGDLGGASIGFIEGDADWSVEEGIRVRTHTSVKMLRDVSPVTFPAYADTDVALRHLSFDRPNRGRSQLILARARARR